MNVLRWLSRVESALCLLGLAGLVAILVVHTALEWATGCGFVWASQAALFGLLLVALFGMGPAADQNAHFRLRWFDGLCPSGWHGLLYSLSYGLAALVFFVLFCLATYVSSETRALGDLVDVLGWPLWLPQGLMVAAFGGNVVRFSLYAAVPALRPTALHPGLFPASSGH